MKNNYIRIMRIDHWIKQLFIIPGIICAYILDQRPILWDDIWQWLLGFICTCLVASSNYVINEYLDARFDRFHPTKKNRALVNESVDKRIVFIIYFGLFAAGMFLSHILKIPFRITLFVLWLMGILYNVKPFRTKDIPYLDVLSESVNNALRLLLGWFLVSWNTLPPVSLVVGYWMCGAFLMSTKRFAEYKMIGEKETAGKYRKSFVYYSEKTLMASSFFYAMFAVLLIGVFLTKYRIEMILFMPFLCFLFCYYFILSFNRDSAVQKPERLYKEKGLMLICLCLIIIFAILMLVDIPALKIFENRELVTF